ncbi:MAG: cellulase family glycosylhydrolase [Cyclobacteriaceae bacterium]|nr:cellulase family glycosylhydrolase [Cyclobacteriaceae bacterium]
MKPLLITFLLILLMIIPAFSQPVSLHPKNPHYFLYKGQPRIFITSAEHYGALLNLDFDYKKYLQTLHDEGMDYTRIFTGAYVENAESFGIERNTLAPLKDRFITPWARSNEPGYINGGNKFDLNQWNPDYFARLHDFLATAEKLDIIVEVTFFSSIYNDGYWKFNPLYGGNNVNRTDYTERVYVHTMQNGNLLKYQEAMVRKLVQELNEYSNVIFEIQNEPWADQEGELFLLNRTNIPEKQEWTTRTNQASKASLAWQDHITGIIAETESKLPNQHLIAQNYANYGLPVPAVNKHVDIMNFHYVWPEACTWNYGYNLPISFDESGFAVKTEPNYRKQAWRFILAGGAVFNNLDYSFVVGQEDGSFEKNTSPGLGTKNLRRQFKILKDFMTTIDFVNMEPAAHLIKHAPGFIWRGLAATGKSYAYYFEGRGTCNVQMAIPDGNYTAEWIDPETGKILESGPAKSKDGLLTLTGPLVMEDVALRVVKK